MRHDYNLPPDWEAMTPEEKDRWFHQVRAYRQAKSQDLNFSRHLKKAEQRRQRRFAARDETRRLER